MMKTLCLAVAFAVLSSIGLAGAGHAQDPFCTGTMTCFTTPLAASGNGSCFVNVCLTFDPVSQVVHVASVTPVTASNCTALLLSGQITPAFMEAVEKEAVRIAIQRCVGCNPPGKRIFNTVSKSCHTKVNNTWVPCTSALCYTSYEVTCDPLDPYTWVWGDNWGKMDDNSCPDPPPTGSSCFPTCRW
jgi:hypothetical protein